ncbi:MULTISPECIES: TrkH family potassium uptake protein [unclassified Isoptericola]|uniref:TrkH family potassium uptake protein n=1 Tax=unclassified Isoptericola TaxID=2623355 RepID=UPI0027123139|nr:MULTISPECIES: potassium transporter TrkG [unclassified Isoptericola]MDO8147228.1 potassium transporter TrkG [Isoptericola sp. b515]MDO8150459.1 potassium transporter TrkG [Isoptericola sp. b408]
MQSRILRLLADRRRSPEVSPASLRRRPARVVAAGFLGAIAAGTLLLSLPVAATGRTASVVEAFFTATSAACVTGLVVVDTETFWSPFGQAVILVLIQIGGFGVMTVASLLGLLLSRRMGLRTRLVAAESTHTIGLGEVRRVMIGALQFTVIAEVLVATVITLRLRIGYGESVAHATWSGLFHSVSAFNNAGFSLYGDSLMRFVTDPWVCLPISAAVIIGGIGFPVLVELTRRTTSGDRPVLLLRRPGRWSVHTRLTLLMTAVLLAVATLFFLAVEWANPRTFGPLDVPGKMLAAFTQAVMPRTAGFNSIDTEGLNHGSWFFTDILMFIGGGSGGTAGGVKVGTLAVLAVVLWAELRGDPDVTAFDRRLAPFTQRQAGTVALVAMAAVVVTTLAITVTVPPEVVPLDRVLFEVVSALSTTGLSTGITGDLEPWHQCLLALLMFLGRLGPITLGTGLALRERRRLYRRPESAVVIG